MITLSPSLLSADFLILGEQIRELEKSGADYLHLDIMDGLFVPNISFGLPVVKSIRKATDLILDTHLMITEPIRYVERFAEAGSDIITIQYESTDRVEETLEAILKTGKKAGLTVSPKTDVKVLLPFLDKLFLVLIMSVEPGFGGQKLIPETLDKVEFIKKEIRKRNLDVKVEIDGGVTLENAPLVIEKGADIIVAGSSVFSEEGISRSVEKFKSL